MPIETLALLIGAAGVALVLGLWVGRRSAAGHELAAARRAGPPRSADEGDWLAAADELSIGLLGIDREGRIEAANRAAEELLGLGPAGLVGRSTIEAFIDHQVEELVARAGQQGRAKGEHRLSGEPQRTLALTAWRAERGVWLALDDVSELHRLRRIRTEFIDNLSHELRTPLTTVRLLTESLAIEAERTDLPPRMRDSIAKIDVETGHLVQMVNEILELSRIEGGSTEMHFEEVPLGALVGGAVERLRTFAERQGVSLSVELPPDRASILVRGDEERLGQVLVNLLHNAIKFSGEGSPVTVSARRDGAQCVISVADHGVGFRAPTWIASSSASTRSTRRATAAVAVPAWASPSRAISSRATAAGCGSTARRAAARRSA